GTAERIVSTCGNPDALNSLLLNQCILDVISLLYDLGLLEENAQPTVQQQAELDKIIKRGDCRGARYQGYNEDTRSPVWTPMQGRVDTNFKVRLQKGGEIVTVDDQCTITAKFFGYEVNKPTVLKETYIISP
ncbi:hypothetical protein MHBO_004925, partial [Bonamia ostreae]